MIVGVRQFTVLLADDDAEDRLLFKEALAESGLEWNLIPFAGGREVIEYLSRTGKFHGIEAYSKPDLILLDLKMPKMNGIEVLRWIRNEPSLKTLPVIIL